MFLYSRNNKYLMLARTHFAFGILTGVLLIDFFQFSSIAQYIVYFLIIHLAVLLPDCDHPESSINKRVKVTKVLTFFVSHRGILHSIFPPIIFSILLYYYANYFIAGAFFIGYFSHLLSDALTVNGINFLYPLINFKISGPIRTGHLSEKIIFWAVVIGIILRIYYLVF